MAVVRAAGELLAPRPDVWALVSEPYHLPDWWPGYTGVEPDRRGLAEGARWTVMRGRTPGLLRRPGGQGLIVLRRVDPTLELRWLDVAQRLEAGDRACERRSRAYARRGLGRRCLVACQRRGCPPAAAASAVPAVRPLPDCSAALEKPRDHRCSTSATTSRPSRPSFSRSPWGSSSASRSRERSAALRTR